MPRSCTVCEHESRPAIDEQLVLGTPARKVAGEFGLSEAALSRHRRGHLSPALARVSAEREAAGSESALDRLELLYRSARTVLEAAEAEGKAGLSLAAIRELRGLVELLARITGELDERPQVAVLNLGSNPEWVAVRSALLGALAPYPDARAAVARALGSVQLQVAAS